MESKKKILKVKPNPKKTKGRGLSHILDETRKRSFRFFPGMNGGKYGRKASLQEKALLMVRRTVNCLLFNQSHTIWEKVRYSVEDYVWHVVPSLIFASVIVVVSEEAVRHFLRPFFKERKESKGERRKVLVKDPSLIEKYKGKKQKIVTLVIGILFSTPFLIFLPYLIVNQINFDY